MMRQNVVVPLTSWAAPQAAVTMVALMVEGASQAFTYQTPLNREVRAFVDRENLVNTPACGAVIDINVIAFAPKTILFLACFIPRPKEHVANDQMTGIKINLIIFDANASAWSCLPGNGDIGMNYLKL